MGADRGPFVDDSISFSWGRDTIIDKAKERETNEIVNSAFLETAPLARCYSTARDRWRQRPAGFLFFPPFLVPFSFFLSMCLVCVYFFFSTFPLFFFLPICIFAAWRLFFSLLLGFTGF